MKKVAYKIIKNQKALFLAMVIVLTSSSIFAQKSTSKWRLLASNKVEAEVVYSESNSIATVSYDNYLKTLDFIIESKMEVEDWMTDMSLWETNIVNKNEEVIEEELAIEDWMLDFKLDEIKESDLALEEWMNSTDCWR